MPQQVLSCIQPTGNLHLGRYFGALKFWVELQEKYDCVYGVVDLHAMTMPFKPDKLRQSTWELVFNMISIGIEPERLFVQSLIPEHTELAWVFNCMASYGELGRMVQFKDKSQQVSNTSKDAFISAGLYTYPALQAADILIYKADFVPVGKDQDQHLELTRNIAQRFNHIVGKEYFVLPETLHTETPKVMSTADPTIKMSASKGEKHNIDLFAEPERLAKQIRSAVTDTGDTPEDEMSAGVANLFSLLKAAGDIDAHTALMDSYTNGSLKYSELKEAVSSALTLMTGPLREKRKEVLANKKQYKDEVKASSAEIRKRAQQTTREVKELIGLLNVKPS